MTKTFRRHRDRVLGTFASLKKKNAAEAVAVAAVETLQTELVAASSQKALVVAATADPHLRSFAVTPLAFVAPVALTPKQAVTQLELSFEVFDACKKNCLVNGSSCTCKKRKWRKRGKLVALRGNGWPIGLKFDDRGGELKLKKLSDINERLKPASGNGDGLSLVRKAARAAALAGWDAPSELASVSRARRG